jgi:hypothetical protein
VDSGVLSYGGKWLGHDKDHDLIFHTYVKNAKSYTIISPYVRMALYLNWDRNNYASEGKGYDNV